MKVKYSFICDAANVAQSGNLNVLGIFTNINAIKFPCTHPRFTYISHIEFHRSEIGKHKFRVPFIDDDGKDIMPTIEGELEISPNALFSNLMIELTNIHFPKPGAYQIDLVIDHQHVSTDSINVFQVNQNQIHT